MIFDRYRFDQQVAMELGEKLLYALIALVITWLAARAAKWAFAKLVDNVSFFNRGTGNGASLGESLGKIVGLLIWLFGLLIILNILELGGVAGPIDSLLENVVDFLPNLLWAGLIFFIGMMVARIVRDLVVTFLQTVDFDKWANRGGVDNVTGNTAISKTIGTIVYVLIAIPVAIAALERLQIESISRPLSGMLNTILLAIPNIIGAALLLGLAYLLSKFVLQIIKEVLPGLGVDRALADTGLMPDGTTASGIIGRIAQIAIILAAAIAATRLLGFPELTAILDQLLELGGRVIFGAVVIAFGFLIANLLARLISGDAGSSTAATIVRWATIILFVFMGLQFTGIGGMIPANALTILIGGVAVAGALAFGLGGRDWAARKLDQMDNDLGGGSAAAPKPKPRKAAAPKSDDPLPPGA
ncbi:mechanosensitive ion channel [Qipengyuania intermedia]|uniref:mechanosensitive ion channel n=1 Tax=Qipengyuania intermedia TaxID=2867244 RepID=UPI0031E7B8AC